MTQQKHEEMAQAQRESINFVSAGSSDVSNKAGTSISRESAAERVMAGLNRETKVPSNTKRAKLL